MPHPGLYNSERRNYNEITKLRNGPAFEGFRANEDLPPYPSSKVVIHNGELLGSQALHWSLREKLEWMLEVHRMDQYGRKTWGHG
jgi:hypothetical protein